MKFVYLLVSVFVFCSCSSTKYVRYAPKAAETYTNANLKSFLKANPRVNVVLRVPNAYETVTTKTTDATPVKSLLDREKTFDIYYNAIEKELLKAGFSVRDRGLFNEVLKKMQRDEKQNIDYSQIKNLTETDVIVEVIKIDPAVMYVTNKVYTLNGKGERKEMTDYAEYKRYGASAEFKVIMLKNNELAGTYKFNYAPCQDGCPTSFFNDKLKIKNKKDQPQAYEGVEVDVMEEFIKASTRDLINAIKGS